MSRITRSQHKAAAGGSGSPPSEAANPPTRLANPLRKENWPQEPRSDEEFSEWMEEMKEGLKKWLAESQALAQDNSTNNLIKEFTRDTKREWEKHKVHTDIQTGEIYDKRRQKKMEEDIRSQKRRRTDLHAKHDTERKFEEYRTAQGAWEDFLYFQNVWNRRNGDREYKERLETVAERRTKERAKERYRERLARGEITADEDYPDYGVWLVQLIKVFRAFHLGYRKRMPTVVGPEDAHRYTIPTRGTTPYPKRLRILEERFPRKKRKVIDPTEAEEGYRSRSERQKDNELERKGGMTPIVWKIDQTRFEEEKNAKEGRESADSERDLGAVEGDNSGKKTPAKYASDRRTLRLLPKDHLLHHGSAESSFDWPTSFESPDWGNEISRTGRKGVQSYGLITYSDEDEDSDAQNIKKVRLPRYRKKGDPELTKPHKTRYKKHIVNKPGGVFMHDQNPDGTVVGRDRDEQWTGHWTDGETETEEFLLDDAGERIPEDRGIGHNVFQTITTTGAKPKTTRRTRHQNQNVTDQLSEDEDEKQPRDPNFKLSGTANPDQVGRLNVDGSSSDTGEDDDESGDEGDLFKQSYEECSCPHRRRAQLLHTRLLAEFGTFASWTEKKTLEYVQSDLSYSDEDICELYEALTDLLRGDNQ